MRALTLLQVHGNPWRSIPHTPLLGPSVPSLQELCYRTMLSPSSDVRPDGRFTTLLEETYHLPLGGNMPDHLRVVLAACVPRSITQSSLPPSQSSSSSLLSDLDEVTGFGICPSPHHRYQDSDGGYIDDRPPVFVQPMTERFVSTRQIAEVTLDEAVPVRWRGCGRGCLDFLDTTVIASEQEFRSEEFDFNDGE